MRQLMVLLKALQSLDTAACGFWGPSTSPFKGLVLSPLLRLAHILWVQHEVPVFLFRFYGNAAVVSMHCHMHALPHLT